MNFKVYEDNQWWYAEKDLDIRNTEMIITELRLLISCLPR